MTVETASFIAQLNIANPAAEDRKREGDDHIRLIKAVLKNTFPNLNGAVQLSSAQLNSLPSIVPGATLRGKVVATAGQTLVTLPFSYTVGANALLVFADGRMLRVNEDYAETNSTQITMQFPMVADVELDFLAGQVVSSPGPLSSDITMYGDVSATLSLADRPLSHSTHIWNVPLTAVRGATLSTVGAFNGGRFRVVRTAAATGGSVLGVLGLKNLNAGQWCDAEYNGSAWFLTAFGSL